MKYRNRFIQDKPLPLPTRVLVCRICKPDSSPDSLDYPQLVRESEIPVQHARFVAESKALASQKGTQALFYWQRLRGTHQEWLAASKGDSSILAWAW